MATLALTGVSFRYKHGADAALNSIDLIVRPGEIVGIVGPNGSGKTTLCLTFNGLVPHAVRGMMTGEVLVDGKSTVKQPVHVTARDVGIVLQNPEAQFFGESVEEEIAFGPENFQLAATVIDARIDSSLASVGMTGFRDRFPFHLSGGQKQRVAIAIALAMEPAILVLDEPTSELDPQGKQEVLETIEALSAQHAQTVIITSHETDELVRIVHRIVALSEAGAVVADGPPHEVLGSGLCAGLGIRQPQLFELWEGRDGAPPTMVAEAAQRLRGWFRPVASPVSSGRIDKPPVITCRDLHHTYANGVAALRGINLDVRPGEFVAIMGRNGSGKTTLSKHLNGLLKPSSGSLSVLGRDPDRVGTAAMARSVGYVFQNPDHQIFSQTIAEEFAFGLRNTGLAEAEIVQRTQEALERAGLNLPPETYPHFLGKGERQRLALATVLAMRPEILVIDEPTTGLDWRNAKATMATLEALNAAGLTIVFVTHDSRLVAEHAHRVVVMADGEVLADGDPGIVFHDRPTMTRAALRPPTIMQLAAALTEDAPSLGIRTVADFRRCLLPAMEHVPHAL